MKKIKINRKRAIGLLAEAVNERGVDYIYTPIKTGNIPGARCVYVRDGEASCGVGVALAKAGVPIEVLSTFDIDPWGAPSFGGGIETVQFNGLLDRNDVILTSKALHVFSVFQAKQDSQVPWGQALIGAILTEGKYVGL